MELPSIEFNLQVTGTCSTFKAAAELTVKDAVDSVMGHWLHRSEYYIVCNGRISGCEERISSFQTYHVVPRCLGGKGGFGSMLRAIGAQIEKTTNREACRDLSGRRMRDINNEKRLREWVGKAADRERTKAERRRERRERMKESRYRFDDPKYEQQRVTVAENLDDAVHKGLENAAAGSSKGKALKRKSTKDVEVDSKKAKEWLGMDVSIDTDESSSSSSDSESTNQRASDKQDAPTSSSDDCTNTEEASNNHLEPSCSHVEPKSGETGCGSSSSTSRADEAAASVNNTAEEGSKGKVDCNESNKKQADITQKIIQSLNLDEFRNAEELEGLGLEILKAALISRGVKCGGTLNERAARLFSTKGLQLNEIPSSLLAKPQTKKK